MKILVSKNVPLSSEVPHPNQILSIILFEPTQKIHLVWIYEDINVLLQLQQEI